METDPSIISGDNFFRIIKRRKWELIIPFFSIFIIFTIVAFILPPIYKSTSTILIEEQVVPIEFVKATVNMYAEQQLQIIYQRVMSSQRLLDIIGRYKLFIDLGGEKASDEIIQKMRKNISLEPISAKVVDPKTGNPSAITIAFTLSYEGENDPEKVYQVANMLASLFLEENIQTRTQQAAEVSGFLENEVAKVKRDLENIDIKIAEFKEKNIDNLPELLNVNIQTLHDAQRDLVTLYTQLSQLKEKEGYLETQLANLSPDLQETDKKRLNELNVMLVNLKNRFSDEHPDVIKTKAEITKLEERIKTSFNEKNSEYRPDNPAYITLASQLSSVRSEIRSIDTQMQEIKSRETNYKSRIGISPQVEQKYKLLLMERSNTQAKYEDLTRKYLESKVSQGLERESKGERFTIIDPARPPEKPYKPNRMAIIMIGFILGLGAGVGTTSVREFADTSIRSSYTLIMHTPFPVLGSIPLIESVSDFEQRQWKLDWRIVTLSILIVLSLVAAFHFLIMDLNVLIGKIFRLLGM